MPDSQPAIAGDFGTRGEWPAAASRTISDVAAASSSASRQSSAGVHHSERARPVPRSLCVATLTKPRGSQRGPDGLRLEVGVETVVAVLTADARGLEAPERRGGIDGSPGVDVH